MRHVPAHRSTRPTRLFAACATVAALFASPAAARADGIFGGFIGTAFGGSVSEFQDEVPESDRPFIYGGVLGGVSRGAGLGFEIDFGYSPDFFGMEDVSGVKTSLTTVMGNLVIGGAAARGIAPFVSGGAGLIRANVQDASDLVEDLTANDFGINIGGGVNAMFSSNVGVRADIRYFRSLASEDEDDDFPDFDLDLADFDFWRGSVGLVVRW